jgi:hypothetical protein
MSLPALNQFINLMGHFIFGFKITYMYSCSKTALFREIDDTSRDSAKLNLYSRQKKKKKKKKRKKEAKTYLTNFISA